MGGLFDIAFRDVITLALAAFMAAVVILIPWVNPPGEKSTDVEETKASGQLIFEIEWKPGLPVDVDMWVKAPGLVPVGYSNLGNQSCNLLRDDLGKQNDPLDGNHEQLVCRDLRRGEYVFNLHYFRGYIRQVGVRWAIRLYDGKHLKEILLILESHTSSPRLRRVPCDANHMAYIRVKKHTIMMPTDK